MLVTEAEPPTGRASLADSLRLVLPRIDARLASPGALDDLGHLARALPPVHRAGFECRLGAGDLRVDLQQGVVPTGGEPAILSEFVSSAGESGSALHPAWARVRDFCSAWEEPSSDLARGVPELWLEYDPREVGARVELVPSVFALLRPPERTAEAARSLAERALAVLLGAAVPSPLCAQLRRFTDACPEGTKISHVGVMLGREVQGLRIHVTPLPLRHFEAFLERVAWPGDTSEVHRLATRMLEFGDYVALCFDVGELVYPRLGIECFFHQKHGIHPRMEPLLDWLVAEGMCTPEKREAMVRWPGYLSPAASRAPWPDALLVQSLVQPPERLGIFDRRFSHVKLSCLAGSPVEAKAYFGYGHLWLEPESRRSVAARVDDAAPPVARRKRGAGDGAVDGAMEAAVSFLLGARNQAGWWRDFYDLARPPDPARRVAAYASDEWMTAYVAGVLAALPGERERRAAREAWELLAARRGPDEGWGQSAQLPADADSTIWGLRLAKRLGIGDTPRVQAARRFLMGQLRPGGGVACYREVDCPEIARFLRMGGAYDGWAAVHTCVTAAALPLGLGDATHDYLLRAQKEDGRWAGYWWDDDEYATACAVESLLGEGREDGRRAAMRGALWAAGRVGEDGMVRSEAHGGASDFAAALALQALLPLASEIGETRAADRALGCLLTRQREDGSFAPSARLRVPAPATLDPLTSPEGTRTYLDRDAVFTTATVLAALSLARSGATAPPAPVREERRSGASASPSPARAPRGALPR